MKKLNKNYFTYSKADSLRFEQNIYRVQVLDQDFESIFKKFRGMDQSMMIIRFPSDHLRSFNSSKLASLPGFIADCLVYYRANLDSLMVSEMQNKINFSVWNKNSTPQIQKLINTIFKDYHNHYFSNPDLPPELITAGYSQWMEEFAKADSLEPAKIGWFCMSNEEISGFATCNLYSEEKCVEGILYGVMPQFTGHGIYADLIRYTQSYFKSQGYSDFYVSTQVQNISVQRAWIKESFKPEASFLTYHLYNRHRKNE